MAHRGPTSGVPRWVWVSGIVGIVVLLAVSVLLLTGDHGPGRHGSVGPAHQQAPAGGGHG